MNRLMKKLDRDGRGTTSKVIELWDTIVGPEIARHTNVEGIRLGELQVAVDSPVWANELQAMAGQLRVRLQEQLGEGSIKGLRFTVKQTVSRIHREEALAEEAERRYGGDRVEPEALSPDELEAVERSVKSIDNEPLRDAARRATIRDLEWKKGQEHANRSQRASGGSSGIK
ncbi:MAG: DUF721 domain-containing protein [Coriobacteriia bacterium]|nr:DUF721 domain-containing protein [Coriobacteriia bacterium]